MTAAAVAAKPAPFDTKRLDKLMDDAGLDVIVATSKHNIQYLLGGYRFFFFDTMEAMGVSRYLPAIVYQKGKPESTAYVGCAMERFEKELGNLWPGDIQFTPVGSKATMEQALGHVRKLSGVRRVGVEAGFIPADAESVLRQGLGNIEITDAVFPLERLRAVKTPQEITHLRKASELVVETMLSVFKEDCRPGQTKHDVAEALRRKEVQRGLVFDYLLITAGTSLNRAPSEQVLKDGDIMSLDSGGNWKGYIGDLCRMGIIGGKPDAELVDLLGFIEEVQQAARKPIRPGNRGGDTCDIANRMLEASPHKGYTDFMAHGMGLVSHEAPRLMNNPRFSYTGHDIELPLEAGMVISVETTMQHPKRGFIKLEDTIIVTPTGWESVGDGGRGWTPAGV